MIAFLLAQTIAITGGAVYPVSGPRLERATILVKDGRIVAVGANLAVPPGAAVIDASGDWVTPGLIDGGSPIGLDEIDLAPETNDASYNRDSVAAAFSVAEGINPASTLIPIARIEGVTATLAVPATGLIRGQAVLIDLDGPTLEAMVIKAPAAMVAEISQETKAAGGGSRAGAALRLRRVLDDALEYGRHPLDWRANRLHALSAPASDLDALQPVLRGTLPFIVVANRRSDLETALRIGRAYHLRLVLAGAGEAWEMATEIARAQVPVLVEPMDNVPSYDALGIRYENAALLAHAGVKVALLETDPHNARYLRQQAGNAVASGMRWDEALRAITLTPAEIFGVADRYGSLEAGKVADLVVWSGDPFELRTRALHVLIRGREIPLVSRQTELFERYRSLPPTFVPAP